MKFHFGLILPSIADLEFEGVMNEEKTLQKKEYYQMEEVVEGEEYQDEWK